MNQKTPALSDEIARLFGAKAKPEISTSSRTSEEPSDRPKPESGIGGRPILSLKR